LAAALAPCTHAQNIFSLNEGFGTNSFNAWGSVQTPDPGLNGTFLSSGGNPDWLSRLTLTTSPNNTVGMGFQYFTTQVVLGNLAGRVEFGADTRISSAISASTPTPTLVPFFIQSARLYTPSTGITPALSNAWSTNAPLSFDLATFSNSSGIPLNPASSVRIGFLAKLAPNAAASGAAVGLDVDNLSIRVIPAPGVMSVLIAGGLLASRRRRRG
jgi:hypothetical protein